MITKSADQVVAPANVPSLNIGSESGTWLLFVPISGLDLGNTKNNEFHVQRVTFVSKERLIRVRRRFGFPFTMAQYAKKHPIFFEHVVNRASTFALVRMTGKADAVQGGLIALVRDELAILSLSQLGFGARYQNARPAISREYSSGSLSYMLLNTETDSSKRHTSVSGKYNELALDERWRSYQKDVFFFSLLRMLNKKSGIANGWRLDLRNAAILAGKSQQSSDVAECFLWNMIAIELLLTRQGDLYSSALPARAEAFIGWTSDWVLEDYEARIKSIYRKRCDLVHSGRRDQLSIDDVLFSDIILLNVFTNIVRHPKLFNSKESIVKFSERVQAEHVLGLKSKVRPKTLMFSRRKYGSEEYKKI